MSTEDLAPLFNPEKGSVVRYGSGKVVSWNADGFANKINFNGSDIDDFSVFGGINALTIQPDDEVAILGYESPGGVSTWFVLGRIIPPGEAASTMVVKGGGIVMERGLFRLVDKSGVSVVYFGDVDAGEETSRGFIFRFDSGGLAFAMGGAPGSQSWGLRDRDEHILVANDAASGAGLARPYLNIPMVPSSGTSLGTGGPFWPQFTNTSYQEVFHCITTLWHPRIAIGVGTSTASGTVDWQLRVDGVTAGSGSGTTGGEFAVPGWGSTTTPDDQRSVQLWCRNTSGAASRVIVDRCYGLQS